MNQSSLVHANLHSVPNEPPEIPSVILKYHRNPNNLCTAYSSTQVVGLVYCFLERGNRTIPALLPRSHLVQRRKRPCGGSFLSDKATTEKKQKSSPSSCTSVLRFLCAYELRSMDTIPGRDGRTCLWVCGAVSGRQPSALSKSRALHEQHNPSLRPAMLGLAWGQGWSSRGGR